MLQGFFTGENFVRVFLPTVFLLFAHVVEAEAYYSLSLAVDVVQDRKG